MKLSDEGLKVICKVGLLPLDPWPVCFSQSCLVTSPITKGSSFFFMC